ncbi:Protein of unknown function [Thermobacillus xylanilyticus]|uniref:Uncharacterized protein n=1 Tax=Thermobacillus xylanilyticus TaxID=76633 RepID=A0ABM8V6C3_THEXY|nr:Protein of unknown function [Thermobacillus xylanilyticus]
MTPKNVPSAELPNRGRPRAMLLLAVVL